MTTDSITSPAALSPAPAPQSSKIEDAAKQFEALMIGQMMRTAREENETDGDSESSTMYDIADQQFSKMLADKGGMGLANMVVSGLKQAPKTHAK